MAWGSEAELGEAVAAWLEVQGWDVFPEVQIFSGGARADIVATRGRHVWVVECKRAFGLAVIAQADAWRRFSHLTSVAVPGARNSDSRLFGERICKERGIGIIHPQRELPTEWHSHWGYKPPALRRKADAAELRSRLDPGHKRHRPGNADSSYHTPFRATCERLAELVKSKTRVTIREAIDGIAHHYQSDVSARSCMRSWVRGGHVAGVALDETTRPYSFVASVEGAKV